jgi:hypothetical protein
LRLLAAEFFSSNRAISWRTFRLSRPVGHASRARVSLFTLIRRLTDRTGRQQQTRRTLRDWLRVEYGIEKPSNKRLAVTDLDSDTWVSEVKRRRGKNHPLTAADPPGAFQPG